MPTSPRVNWNLSGVQRADVGIRPYNPAGRFGDLWGGVPDAPAY